MGTRNSDKHQLLRWTCTNQTTSWLVHILNTFGARTSNGQTQTHHGPNLGEATTFSLIVYFVAGHGTSIQMAFFLGVPKFPKLGLLQLWGPITLSTNLWLRWGLKQSCSPCWKLSNGMSYFTYMQGNLGDSRLLMVGSHIVNLTSSPSFGHNLYFWSPNRSCELISNIYVPRSFQWYEKRLNLMSFDPCNHLLKIWESI
jgi:hypothetical protein